MNDVISAISTPFGRGGIAVIRMTGEGALEAANGTFRPKNGKKVSELPGGSVVYGDIFLEGERIDDGCVAVNMTRAAIDAVDAIDYQRTTLLLRENVFRFVELLRQHVQEFKNCVISSIAPMTASNCAGESVVGVPPPK